MEEEKAKESGEERSTVMQRWAYLWTWLMGSLEETVVVRLSADASRVEVLSFCFFMF